MSSRVKIPQQIRSVAGDCTNLDLHQKSKPQVVSEALSDLAPVLPVTHTSAPEAPPNHPPKREKLTKQGLPSIQGKRPDPNHPREPKARHATDPKALLRLNRIEMGPKGDRLTKHIRLLAQPFAEEALQVLHDLMVDPQVPPGPRILAANSILDRAWGRPKEHIELDATPDAEVKAALAGVGIAELRDLLRAVRAVDVSAVRDGSEPGSGADRAPAVAAGPLPGDVDGSDLGGSDPPQGAD